MFRLVSIVALSTLLAAASARADDAGTDDAGADSDSDSDSDSDTDTDTDVERHKVFRTGGCCATAGPGDPRGPAAMAFVVGLILLRRR